MKTNLNKLLTAIMLCSMLLVALPVIAAAQEDETLDIYGNANEDDIIDMRDLTFTARMILRLEDETDLADANYDGRVSVADMTQIGLIILGRESKLTLVDGADRIVTVNKPVERIVATHYANSEEIKILGAWNRVVAADYYARDELLFPGASELPLAAGPMGGYDVYYETVFEVDPDVFLTCACPFPGLDEVVATLEPEIPVVALNFYDPRTVVENTRKLRYVLNTEEDGEEFIAFYEGVINEIEKKTAGLSEDEKPTVFLKAAGWTPEALSTHTAKSALGCQIEIPGGINIADEEKFGELEFVPEVDSEWLIDKNPDVVVAHIWEVHYLGALGFEVDDTSIAEATREEIMAMDVFAGGKAAEAGRVYLLDDQMMGTQRFVAGMAYLAKWFHPELFEDFDPQSIFQEYLTRFMRVDYDLDEHGVFVYQEPYNGNDSEEG